MIVIDHEVRRHPHRSSRTTPFLRGRVDTRKSEAQPRAIEEHDGRDNGNQRNFADNGVNDHSAAETDSQID